MHYIVLMMFGMHSAAVAFICCIALHAVRVCVCVHMNGGPADLRNHMCGAAGEVCPC
jgi:hypothetical protein